MDISEQRHSDVMLGIAGINKRLDRVNGRLDKHDDELGNLRPAVASLQTGIKNLDNEVFERPHREFTPPPLPEELVKGLNALVASASGDNKPAFTVRDVRVLAGAGKILWLLLGSGGATFLWWVYGEFIKRGGG